jgi:tetratricopeptide (TPR) repeat protein
MDRNTFWQIIDDVNSDVDGDDYDGILRAMRERLMNYDPEEIADWFSHQRYYRDLADTGGVFAAACCFNDYVSSDGFNDFRMWLISRGREVYMTALKNPDALADLNLRENTRTEMASRWEAYGYVAIGAYKEILPNSDIYEMMEQRPLSAAQKADIRAELEYFPHKVSDQDAARQLLPNLCAKYITPDMNFEFTYRNDEDEAKNLLSDAPDSLKGIALRKLEDFKKSIPLYSKFINIPDPLREELTALQNAVTAVLDDAMSQIREYGVVLMTGDNIEIDRELLIEDDHINAYVGAWFDVDARFGTQTYDTDDYVNVYANYFPETEELEVGYTLITADGSDSDFVAVELADTERDAILTKLREAGLDECVAEMQAEPDEDVGIQLT